MVEDLLAALPALTALPALLMLLALAELSALAALLMLLALAELAELAALLMLLALAALLMLLALAALAILARLATSSNSLAAILISSLDRFERRGHLPSGHEEPPVFFFRFSYSSSSFIIYFGEILSTSLPFSKP